MHEESVAKLRYVLSVMKMNAEKIDMFTWLIKKGELGDEVNPERHELINPEECGTVGCIAGFTIACLLSDDEYTSFLSDSQSYSKKAAALLGISRDKISSLFYTSEWDNELADAYEEAQTGLERYAAIEQAVEAFIKELQEE